MWRSFLTVGAAAALAACGTETPIPTTSSAMVADVSSSVVGTPAFQGPYERIDLGAGVAVDVNDTGQVLVQSGGRVALWYRGALRDLGTLGGATASGLDLNERGQVTGSSLAADGTLHAFLWTDGVMQDLGPRNARSGDGGGGGFGNIHPRSGRKSINNAGEVIWTVGPAGAERAMLWRSGAAQDIGTLGGAWAIAQAINDAGQVAGVSFVPADSSAHAFLWEDGVMRDLGRVLGVTDLNESGHVLATIFARVGCCITQRMLLWDGTELRDITTGSNSLAADLNDRMQVAATTGADPGWFGGRAMLWDGTARILGGVSISFGTTVNEKGTVAGYFGPASSRPRTIVFEGDSAWIMDAPFVTSSERSKAMSINNHGDVAGGRNSAAILWRRIHAVDVDVKPGDDTSAINTKGGRTPVALLSSASFDALSADAATISFAGAPQISHVVEDVNGDGLPDAVYFFDSRALELNEGSTQACLRGETLSGKTIKGCDAVTVR
jgi:probable HAF family extracellular repeat protein